MPNPRLAIAEPSGFGATTRTDAWWAGPLVTALVLGSFVIYATWRGIMNSHYSIPDQALLSPLYSPLIVWEGMPTWLSPAGLILWGPAGFRATCYYYRKAYYRAFFMDPVACAVGERSHNYKGETSFPFILQNMHRFFLYVALIFNVILWYDAIIAFFPGGSFGVTVGSLVLTANAALLMFYSLSCHSLRHLVGGKLDCFSCSAQNRIRHKAWGGLTKLNENHMLWAWTSLIVVAFADFYVFMVSTGWFYNLRLI